MTNDSSVSAYLIKYIFENIALKVKIEQLYGFVHNVTLETRTSHLIYQTL